MLSDSEFKKIFPVSTPREGQREIIEKIINAYESGKKYVILDAPTGTGKSIIGYAIAKYFKSAYILTSQKILQEQYFQELKVPYVLGRSNYPCLRNGSLTCEMGACFRDHKKFCKKSNNIICPYLVHRSKCLTNNFSNLNYSYFLSLSNISSDSLKNIFQKRPLIICDEAHNLENELVNYGSLLITRKQLSYIGQSDIKFPDINSSNGDKCAWLLTTFFEKIRSEYLYLKSQIQSLSGLKSTREYKTISYKFSYIEKIIRSIGEINDQIKTAKKGSLEQKFVITQDADQIEFKPLFAINIFKRTMLNFGDKFLFMSASILNSDVFCKNIGINKNEVEYIQCDSTFPIKNRLIHYTPIGSMSFKNKEKTLPKMIKEIDLLLNKYNNVKGIIHTVNYSIAEQIIEGLSFSNQSTRLLMPRGKEKQLILDTFYASKKPYVLISPSLVEGIDLKEDLSRLCIICKVPYANLANNWIKERMKIDPLWYTTHACINLIQMSGRSIRSNLDYANTYILDNDFINLATSSINIFPKWWQDAVITK